jgi:hypothetical protein
MTSHANNQEVLMEDFAQKQLQHFQEADPHCRGLQLPEGIMLRYTLVASLYFYLHSGVREGKILTRIFASDSPYDRQKTGIGEVATPMFERNADFNHFQKLQALLHSWVDFVRPDPNSESPFRSFEVKDRPE